MLIPIIVHDHSCQSRSELLMPFEIIAMSGPQQRFLIILISSTFEKKVKRFSTPLSQAQSET
jgi:hypothetical protein